MKSKQLFIPKKIAVGFQNREGTYTKKLAYVIYYDQKGTKRKEKSWNNWRDHKIDDVDFDNVPTEGFVLNKGVGGARQSYGWNARNEYIRVYDPRDFEFEISVANLLFILKECDCSRGKGLEGKFVYSWDGTELVLLPETSSDYQVSQSYTKLQGQGVKAKDLIPGATYTTKKQDDVMYLGRFARHTLNHGKIGKRNMHVFWGKNVSSYYSDEDSFIFKSDLKFLAVLSSDVVADNYAELVEKYSKSKFGSKIVDVFSKELPKKKEEKRNYYYSDGWVTEDADNVWTMYDTCYRYGKPEIDYIKSSKIVRFENGKLTFEEWYGTCSNPESKNNSNYYPYYRSTNWNKIKWIEPTGLGLFIRLESGSEFQLCGNSI
jgi:hypothetical protein